MLETLILALIAAIPAITSLTGIILAVGGFVKAVKELKAEVVNTKEYTELKEELRVAHKENRELKKYIKELLTAIDKVVRPDCDCDK